MTVYPKDRESEHVRVADLRKNAQERLRIDLHNFKGHDLISLRIWLGGAQAAIPTPKGITVAAALIPQLRQALDDAERIARQRGILAAEG